MPLERSNSAHLGASGGRRAGALDLGAGDAAGEIGGDSCAAGTVVREGGVAALGNEVGSRGVFCWGSYPMLFA